MASVGQRHGRDDSAPHNKGSTAAASSGASSVHAPTAPIELIHDLKALQTSDARFAAFDERRVRATVAAINEAESELQALRDNPHVNTSHSYFAVGPAVVQAAADRSRKCLAAYLSWRLQALTALWWDAMDDRVLMQCTTAERKFLSEYSSTMLDYLGAFQVPVDARTYLSRPPSVPPSNLVEIRGLVTTSFVSTNSGDTVDLYPGKVMSLPFDEAENLLQRGVAELVRSS